MAVVAICGSTRFKAAIDTVERAVVESGDVPLSPCWAWMRGGRETPTHASTVEALRALHLRKIEMADKVIVVCPGGYIGESTAAEVAHAASLGIPVEKDERDYCLACGIVHDGCWHNNGPTHCDQGCHARTILEASP